MENLIKAGRLFFAIMLVGLAGQQFYYGDFMPVILPPFPAHFPGEIALVYLLNVILIGAAVGIVLNKKARILSLGLAAVFLFLLFFCHLPYELWVNTNVKVIGTWNNFLKMATMAGGALILAGSYGGGFGYGRFFVAVMLIIFGIEHFLYADGVQHLVPDWVPGHYFWTYVSAVGLIATGVSFMLRVQMRLAGLIQGASVFVWFLVLHIPRAVVAPVSDHGNELASVFESLGFSGILFLIAFSYVPRPASPQLTPRPGLAR